MLTGPDRKTIFSMRMQHLIGIDITIGDFYGALGTCVQ